MSSISEPADSPIHFRPLLIPAGNICLQRFLEHESPSGAKPRVKRRDHRVIIPLPQDLAANEDRFLALRSNRSARSLPKTKGRMRMFPIIWHKLQ